MVAIAPARPEGVAVVPEMAPAPAEPPIEARTIGFAMVPAISAAARKANRDALRHHRKGDFAASRTGFAEAVRLAPDHDIARFNLACAHARLGEFAEARAELTTVLRRDLLRFLPRWRGPEADTDLRALRDSPLAVEVDRLVQRLQVAWGEAQDVGVAAYLYRHVQRVEDLDVHGEHNSRGGTQGLIAGVWLHGARRFVPLTRGGTVALVDPRQRRALVATTRITFLHCSSTHGTPTVSWVSTDPAKAPASSELFIGASALGVDPKELVDSREMVQWLAFGFVGDRVVAAVDYYDAGIDRSASVSLGPNGPDPLEVGTPRPDFDGPFLGMYLEGARQIATPPPGWSLEERLVTVPGRDERVRLDEEWDQLVVPDSAESVLLLRYGFGVTDDSDVTVVNDTTIGRLDLDTGDVDIIASGPSGGWVTLGEDGSMFVDVGGRTSRYATPDATTPEPTMDGLHLTMPLEDPFCDCCG